MGTRGKTAIILLGGGMKSAHGAGFLYALATKLHVTNPGIIIAVSGDAGNSLYFAAAQHENCKRMWLELLSTPKFISFVRVWQIMNIDYLIDTVFKQEEPLNLARLAQSPIEWLIPVTDAEVGTTRYISKHDNIDTFEVLRAAKAIPFFFGKKIPLFGRLYIDGGFCATTADHMQVAREHGATRILIIGHSTSASWFKRVFGYLLSYMRPRALRTRAIRAIKSEVSPPYIPGSEILFIACDNLPARVATRNATKLRATFEQGEHDALAHESEIRALFTV